LSIPRESVVDLSAHFLGKQGVYDAVFFPEILKVSTRIAIPDFQ